MSNYSLRVHGVWHEYQTPQGTLPALDNVNFKLPEGSFTCLVGPSGCGKSTLLRLVAGLLKTQRGDIIINESLTVTAPLSEVGIVFQKPTLMPWRSVEKNLTLPLELSGVPRQEQQTRVDDLLNILGLQEFKSAYPAMLSGGMAQRVAIGRGLIQNPDVLLLDEPFGALDALTREQVSTELLRVWQQTQQTILMVTHSIQEAVMLADKVLVMSPRPGTILHHIPIPLPRPRDITMTTTPEFGKLAAQVRAGLQ